eukprot:m.167342 g.167342  ORF g.167342 m.167342 type:complete len:166 (+) comp53165_c0_seq2:78-575(+)
MERVGRAGRQARGASTGLLGQLRDRIFGRPDEPKAARPAAPFIRPRTPTRIHFDPVAPPATAPAEVGPAITAIAQQLAAAAKVQVEADVSATSLSKLDFKYQVLSECNRVFGRVIPSYKLNSIQTVSDVIKFYEEPWTSQTRIRDRPLFYNIDVTALPINLRIFK